jgi:1-acyl-sn-glycerol-3-phosphate acyltransferase
MLRQALYHCGQTVMRAYASALLDMDVRLQTPLPAGPKILAVNHPTTLDPFLLLTITREEVSILVTEFCFALPVFGHYLRGAGHIPVAHSNGRPAFDEAVRRLNGGHTVGIFPEGALSPIEGGVCRAHTGMARLALTAHAPVIPVGIAVQRERIHFRETHAGDEMMIARWVLGGKYAMTVGKPLYLDGAVNDRVAVHAATAEIMQHIVALSAQSAARLPATSLARAVAVAR